MALLYYSDEEVADLSWIVRDRDGALINLTSWTYSVRYIRVATNDLIDSQTTGATVAATSPNFVLNTFAAASLTAITTSLTTTVPASSAVFRIVPYLTLAGTGDMALKASGKPLEVTFALPAS